MSHGPNPKQLDKTGAVDGNGVYFDASQTPAPGLGVWYTPQRSEVHVAANTTTSSATFVTLLTTSITLPRARKILVLAGFSASASSVLGTPNLFFQLLFNGVAIGGAGPGSAGLLSAAALTSPLGPFLVSGLAGVNTFALQWRLNTGLTGGVAQVNPTTANANEFASLYIEEKP